MPGIDHYRLQHPGDALTCQPAPVTVVACQNADCSSLYTGAVTVDLTPSGSLTFSGGSGVLPLRRTTPGTVTLGIASASPLATNSHQCSGGPAGTPCALTFHDTGFLFDVPDLTACQGSGNVAIRAVRTSDTTQACVAAGGFANTTRAISFWTDYQIPVSGSRALDLNGTAVAGSSPGTAINLNFDGSATAQFTASYLDAGQLQLNARFDGSGEEAGLVMVGSDSFTVRPDRFLVAPVAGGTPLTNALADGEPKWPAGEDFRVEVRAACADGTVTPNFAADVVLSPVAPATGNLGLLQNGALAAASFGGGIAARDDVSYGEVGNFTLQARAADYLGTGPVSGTALVGRFTPHHFAVITPDPQFGTGCAAGGFTYLGQPFHYLIPPVITVTAQNKQNATTSNYTGPWWKITSATLSNKSYTAADGTLDTSAEPAVDPVIVDSGDGTGTLTFSSGDPVTGGFAFTRTIPEAPFNAEIGLAIDLADGDGIIPITGNPVTFGTAAPGSGIAFDAENAFRYGRMALPNAYGPEILSLPLPLRAEYFIGPGNGWGINDLDACTPYAVGDLAIGPWEGATGGATGVVAGGPWTLVNGLGTGMQLSAPGSGLEGNVDLTLTVPAWLRLDLDGDGLWQENPTARATFGIYKGRPRLIYVREAYR